jgi:beta-1,4-mannosyltransferase
MASLAPVSIWTDPRTFFTLVSIAIVPYTVLAVAFILYTRSKPIRARSSVVLVLGDFGRSPRMMYHAQSLVEHGWETFVVAYGDTAPIASLTAPGFTAAARTGEGEGEGKGDGEGQHGETDQVNDANNADNDQPKRGHCHLHYLSPLTRILSLPLPWAARAAIRLIHQCIAVLYILWIEIPCYTEFIIVQTPPAIPTLMLVQIAAMVSGSKVVVDWHNTGWSVLAQRLGRWRGVMWLAKRCVLCV